MSLNSPNHPGSYPPDTDSEWMVESLPDQNVLVNFKVLSLERPWDVLTVSHFSNNNTPTVFSLSTEKVTSLILPAGKTVIGFCSDVMQESFGFALDVYVTSANDTGTGTAVDLDETFACRSGMQLVSASSRCDGFVDCHDYSDEVGCKDCDPSAYRCKGSDLCLLPILQCDGVKDCPHGDDEAFCEILQCPLTCSCGESLFHGRHGPITTPCGDPVWMPFWVNCSDGWDREYANQTASKAIMINLNGAPVRHLEQGYFQGLENAHTLDMESCGLTQLSGRVFEGLSRLWKLILKNNSLTFLESGTFEGLHNLRLLYMEVNMISRLDEGCFRGLDNLFFIDFEYNHLSEFQPRAFEDLGPSLERMSLANNFIESVTSSMFHGLRKLFTVSFKDNPITTIQPEVFSGLPALADVRLQSSSLIRLTPDIFDGLSELQLLSVYDHRICCMVSDSLNCRAIYPAHPLFTCRKTFLQSTTIKVFIWILGISALLGNGFVIVMRLRDKPSTTAAAVQSILITNLAMSDFLMGVYLLILGVMDLYIGESYFWDGLGNEWRSSIACQIAGFLSFLSSETSVFLVTLISIDRFICLVFPFSQNRLGVSSARVAAIIIWCVSLLLSVVSLLLNILLPDAYGLSDVCVGLPLIRKFSTDTQLDPFTFSLYGINDFSDHVSSTASTWYFSIAIFLVLNLISFVVILVCYIAIFFNIRFSRKAAGKKTQTTNEIRMAIRMSFIVGTDFFCWMPIIILGILVQARGIILSSDVYAWLVVFVLPINSSINPYLYSLFDYLKK